MNYGLGEARTGQIRQITREDIKDNLHVRNHINHFMLVQPKETEEEATDCSEKSSALYRRSGPRRH